MANQDEEFARWKAVGWQLGNARRLKKLSKRRAADAAGISDITWRTLESGVRQLAPGVLLPASPRDETLEAAARAVDLDPAGIFELAGREYVAGDTDVAQPPASLNERVSRLESSVGEIRALLRDMSGSAGATQPGKR